MNAIAYLRDPHLHEQANKEERNYWPAYIPDLLDWLGVPGCAVEPGDLERADTLSGVSVLFLATDAADSLRDRSVDLGAWVRKGGLLVGFMPRGLDALFGVETRTALPQGADPFVSNTTFGWGRSALTRGVATPLQPPEPLQIFSDRALLCPPRGPGTRALGFSTEGPAVVYHRVGKGATLYFAFDLAQTAWVIRQGRPVYGDYDRDGFGCRTSDGMVLGMRHIKALVLDEILFVLERVIARHGVPSLDRLPPRNGRASDLVLFWGGDDEGHTNRSQRVASDFMKSKGLPYHINVMPDAEGRFGLRVADARRIRANGHELSVHFNFVSGWKGLGYTRDDVRRQWQLFVDRYRVRPQVYVAHCCRWWGWDETPLWAEELGIIGENNRIGLPTPLRRANPTDQIGFAWGTVFPFFYRAGYAHGNRRIRMLSLPIHMYEAGYDKSADTADFTNLHAHLDLALKYRLTSNAFYHPCNFVGCKSIYKAVQEILRYTKARKANVTHAGPDELARWWMARAATAVESDSQEPGRTAIRVATECDRGVTLRIPGKKGQASRIRINGRTRRPCLGTGMAQGWTMVALDKGEHEVVVG